MASIQSETIWLSMIAARQLSTTYYTLSTCLTDLLHRYLEMTSSENNSIPSSLFHDLDQTLFSSNNTSINQSKLLDEYSNILQNILKQNTLHTNIIQNVRRLFRFDTCLKQLFTTELNEHCQCQECDCTISNSITDVIHDVGEIRTNLLIESTQIPCACFRCSDQNQFKSLTFKQFSPCLALIVNRLNINANEQLQNVHGVLYDLVYIIELDSISRSIINVYLRQDTEFIKVDGVNISSRSSTINGHGKFLTLWLSRSTINPTIQPSDSISTLLPSTEPTPTFPSSQSTPTLLSSAEPILTSLPSESIPTLSLNDTYLSPPQSASSSSQTVSNPIPINDTSIPYHTESTITFDDILMPTESTITINHINDDDEINQFWDSFNEQSASVVNDDNSTTTTTTTTAENDSVSDLFLTLLHSTHKDSTSIKTRTEHDRSVNTLASDVLWPLILDQTNRRNPKKSSSSTTTTIQSISSNSSITSSTARANRTYKQLPSTVKSRRTHPYTTA